MNQLRIVSLIASATEIVCALGFENELVGRSHECDYPPSVKNLPQLTSPKFNVEGTSYEIDQRVKAIVEDALSVYRVDAQRLDELQPTHIITQSQCEVCAVSLKDVEQAVCEMVSSEPIIVSLEPNSLADIWADIQRVADALGAPERADSLINMLTARMDAVARRARALDKPTVACVEWIEPLMAAGNWMPELVEMAGGANLFGEAGKHSPWMTWEELVSKDPDVIFVSPCGFDIKRTMQEMNLLSDKPEWTRLRAVQSSQVFIADGNQYFNRPGPRIVESLEILAEILHPKAFRFGHEGAGWIRYDGLI
ncbi:MAG TPA: cobalamin-binding protein [Blastocatellia bacterium]|nr:cobalamin-binding protein [Blastocatellia bacterium]